MRYRVLLAIGGFFTSGPIGALIGYWIGSKPDKRQKERDLLAFRYDGDNAAAAAAIVGLGAKLAKADGRITDDEVRAFKRQFQVPPGQDVRIARLWNEARDSPAGFENYARQLALTYHQRPAMLEKIYLGLEQVAAADGQVTDDELVMLHKIARLFGLEDVAGIPSSGETPPHAFDPEQADTAFRDTLSSDNAHPIYDRLESADVALRTGVIRRTDSRGWSTLRVLVSAGLGIGAFFIGQEIALLNNSWISNTELAMNFIAAIGVTALTFIWFPRPRPKDQATTPVGHDMAATIQAIRHRIATIARRADRFGAPMGQRLKAICEVATRIVDGFGEDPEDFHRSRRVLSHYLIATEDLARRYGDLSRSGADSARVHGVLEKFEPVLVEIEDLFQRQLAKNYETEARGLDLDIEVLRETIKSETL